MGGRGKGKKKARVKDFVSKWLDKTIEVPTIGDVPNRTWLKADSSNASRYS